MFDLYYTFFFFFSVLLCSIQLKYKHEEDWSAIMGREYGTAQEIILYDDEFIVQVFTSILNSNVFNFIVLLTLT